MADDRLRAGLQEFILTEQEHASMTGVHDVSKVTGFDTVGWNSADSYAIYLLIGLLLTSRIKV
jgi:hypothetical protein